ncbi:MAG: DNA-3-methyladenine glycosylase [Opitutaceae bacterium]|jgi:DNA-3-methyladenine glycosylase|nr:DNA-3-methyladenine glycosylase [Opitutaceae bacterium]
MPAPIKAKVVHNRSTVAIARGLLGRVLARRHPDGRVTRHVITETEAYHGETDLACHASKGRTARTEVMYRAGGLWYVYLCYGVHEMLNLVTGPEGFPAAVLIRGLADVSGPGRLTRVLGIGRGFNGCSALDEAGGLWLEERPGGASRGLGRWIQATPRIGVAYAGPEWAAKPWRFVLRMPEV